MNRGLLFLLSFILGVWSTPTWSIDLLAVFNEAKDQDPIYAAAQATFASMRELVPQSEAILNADTELQLESSWNRIDFDGKSGSSFTRDYGDHQARVLITQPIYQPKLNIALEQAKSQLQISEIQLEVEAQRLIIRVSELYFTVLQKTADLSAVIAEKLAVGEQLEQAKRNFLVGTATVTDQREAQARYDLVLAQELVSKNDLEVAKSQIGFLLGRRLSESLSAVILPIDLPGPYPSDMQLWIEQSQKSNLDVLIAKGELNHAQQEVARQNADYQPTIDAVGSHTYADQGFSSFGKYNAQSTVLGLRLRLPLYKGGGIKSKVRQAVAEQETARQNLEGALRRSVQTTSEAFLGVTSGLARVTALEQAVASTQLQLESTKLGQEVGVRTAVDVLDAEQQLSGARRDLYDAVYSTILAQLRLKASVGKLNKSDLESVNKLLQ